MEFSCKKLSCKTIMVEGHELSCKHACSSCMENLQKSTHPGKLQIEPLAIIAERLSVRRIIVGCILAMNDRPTD